jgi:hypothetical protein
MDRRNPPRRGLWTFSDAVDIAIWLTAIAAVSIGWAAMASAQDAPLDLSILAKLDAPAAAQAPPDALDLSILERLDRPAATAPGDALDVTLLDALNAPAAKPAVKPSKAALRSLGAASGVELGCEIGREFCRPAMPNAASGVNLRDTTINPPNSRKWNRPDDERQALIEHLIGHPNHSPHGFTFDALNRLDLATLERLHSNDHDQRLRLPQQVAEAPRQSAANCPNGVCPVPASTSQTGKMPPVAVSPPTWGGTRFYWPSSRQWMDSPEPGVSYPTMGGVLVQSGTVSQAAPIARQPVYVRGNCPGGVCPVR